MFPAEMIDMAKDAVIFRNQDHEFDKILAGKTSERKISLDILFSETDNGFAIQLKDEAGVMVSVDFEAEKQEAKNKEMANRNIIGQLSKLGNTIYEASGVELDTRGDWFIPAGQLNEWRRMAIEQLDEKRAKDYKRPQRREQTGTLQFPETKLSYLGNVINEKAESFYKQFGVEEIMPGFEAKADPNVPLMYCKYCIKHAMGWCPREGHEANFVEPLYLEHKDEKFRLEFDCKKCEMLVLKA